MEKGDTWPQILTYNYETYGDARKAMRYKHYGIWQPYTWKEYYLDVKYTALGLLALGFQSGERLLIVGDNAPQWYASELAAQAVHGVSVAAYSESAPAEIKYIGQNCEAGYAIVEDQEQVDKLLEIKDDLPLLKRIIYWNYKGLAHYNHPLLLGYRELLRLGKEYEEKHSGRFEESVKAGKAGDVCSIVYTSGTTGEAPKGAVHTFKTMRTGAEFCLQLDRWHEEDTIIPFLPPAWMTEQWFAFGCHLLSGSILNIAETPETLLRDAREIEPSIAFYGARVWESQAAAIQARILGITGLRGLAFHLLMPIGYRMADLRLKKKKQPVSLKLLYFLADAILFKRMRKSLGLSHARICYSAGARLSTDASNFYHALNIPVKSLYATTEGGVLACAGNDEIDPDTVGRPIPGSELRLADNGEVVCRQPGTFVGYYKDVEKTARALRDGWFFTGDTAVMREDGQLVFLDRTDSLAGLINGERMVPQAVESRLRSSPYIKDAWVLAGPDRAYVSAVIIINYGTVSRWAGQAKITFSSFTQLSQSPDVYALVLRDITRVNSDLPPGCRIRRYVNLHKEFDPDTGEVTRTRNLRRRVLEERYRDLIQAIYADMDEGALELPIQYQSGQVQMKNITLQIKSVEGVRS